MEQENCPNCGMPWSGRKGAYECGSYTVGIGGGVVREPACTEIARLKTERVVPEWDRNAFTSRYLNGEWDAWEIRTAQEGYEFAALRAQEMISK